MRVQAATVGQIHEGKGKRVTIAGHDIALFKLGGKIYAINNVCAHQHLSVLDQGALTELTVSCPMHGWTYDLRTGKSTTGQGAVATYQAVVEDGMVYLVLPDPS